MRYRTTLSTLLVLSTGVVFAHAELMSSTPEAGQTVNTVPTEVELVFSENVEVEFSTFKVYPLPDTLAAAEAAAASSENMVPLPDDSDDDPTADMGADSSDDDADTGDTGTDDTNTNDHGDDVAGDDHDDTGGSNELAAFVSSTLSTQGDEAERVDTEVSSQGSQVSIALGGDLPAGWYVVMWSALSGDEHPAEGYVTFNYEP